jgi:hypothetical protein
MTRLPVISTDQELNNVILKVCAKFKNTFYPVFVTSFEAAIEDLNYELPELSVINFSDTQIDARKIMETVRTDPWLHYGGIIGVHRKGDAKQAEDLMQSSNVVGLISRRNAVSDFYRLLKILNQNRQILFQRDLQNYLLQAISGSFIMDGDPFNVKVYSNLVTNYLYNLDFINHEGKERLHVALMEMLMNAVEHGSCRISYDEKTAWLNSGRDIIDLIRDKLKDPELQRLRIFFSYRIAEEKSSFSIRDEGPGFDWKSRLSPTDLVNLEMHGHGIRMTKHYMENLRYNEKGNEVFFEVPHRRRESNVVPGLFANRDEITFEDGQVVVTEGEESNYLYYIASGSFDILSQGKKLASLSPQDILLGEMSFLLNNRRSATVIARGKSTLLKISKNEFVNIIKAKPHYGILLARLIAQRLSTLNSNLAALKRM